MSNEIKPTCAAQVYTDSYMNPTRRCSRPAKGVWTFKNGSTIPVCGVHLRAKHVVPYRVT